MKTTACFWLFSMALLAIISSAEGQQSRKIPSIAYLDITSASSALTRFDAFRQGLYELGYKNGENTFIESRYAEGNLDRLKELATEIVRLKVDVIVTGGPSSTRAAHQATATIPIVTTQDSDPIGNGFVASLARPGGNITGLSTLSSELSSKRLETLKEVVPRLSRVSVFRTSTTPGGDAKVLNALEGTAQALQIKLQISDILATEDFEIAFQNARKYQAHAVLVLTSPVFIAQRRRLVGLAEKNRLPVIYYRREYVEDGGLMSYAPNLVDLSRRAATYVDKILKGAKPADLPVEQPTKFEFIINLKAAKQIGLTVPPNVLARADRVIK